MAEENRTTFSKSDEVTTNVVRGLALMEDVFMGRTSQNDLDEYSIELQDTWPVEEAMEEILSDQAATAVAISVLNAHRQNVIEEDTGISPERRIKRLIGAVRSELINLLREDVTLALLAGRLFVAGYMAADAQGNVLPTAN